MEYVIDRFHGRSLALAHSREEIEELALKSAEDSLTEQKWVKKCFWAKSKFPLFISSRLVRHDTYRVRRKRTTPSIIPDDETIQSLRQSTMQKQQLIDETTRKVKEAENNAHLLNINIQ